MSVVDGKQLKALVATRLRERRLNAGYMTKAKVAELLDISNSAYRNYEAEIRIPDYPMMKRIADLFKTNPAYLVGWTDKPNPPRKRRGKNSL